MKKSTKYYLASAGVVVATFLAASLLVRSGLRAIVEAEQ